MKLKHAGFTLVETLMVLVVLGIVMLAASGLASTVVRSASQNQARVQAIYLAQECTELVRNARDSSWRQNLDWRCPFMVNQAVEVGNIFTIENTGVTSTPIADCQQNLGITIKTTTPEQAILYERENRGLTHDSNSTPSLFQRYLEIDDYDEENETIDITCHVNWPRGGTQISQRLSNWRKK